VKCNEKNTADKVYYGQQFHHNVPPSLCILATKVNVSYTLHIAS